MKNIDMAREWLKASLVDLAVIKEIIHNENLTTMTAFHSQQSAEKSLKALLEYHNEDVPKIHQVKKLVNLTKEYIEHDIDIELVIKIDTLYIDSKYPGDMGLLPYGKPSFEDSMDFYHFAGELFEKVCLSLNVNIIEEELN